MNEKMEKATPVLFFILWSFFLHVLVFVFLTWQSIQPCDLCLQSEVEQFRNVLTIKQLFKETGLILLK